MIPENMRKQYQKAHDLIKNTNDTIQVYTHIDCDGMCSGAIISTILDRQNKKHQLTFTNLNELNNLQLDNELTIFTDLGSGQEIDTNANKDNQLIILDHHPPLKPLNYHETVPYTYLEINPNYYGIDGSTSICGGGLSYLLAKTFGYTDLSWIGVLASIGDMQNSKTGKLEGLNQLILNDAVKEGYIRVNDDLSLYGRETRPIQVALSYFSDVKLPFTNNVNEAIALLKELNIPIRDERDRPRTLSNLTGSEKGRLFSKLVEMISREVPIRYSRHIPKLLLGDTYDFLMEEEDSFLSDGSEFSTAMNACGRNQEYQVALDILKGDRVLAYDQLLDVSRRHRFNLRKSVEDVLDIGITGMGNIQYVDTSSYCDVPNIGVVIGMILGYGDWRKPIVGIGRVEDEDMVKVSLRCSRLLVFDGVHFGDIVRRVAGSVGGNGGGHAVACGAYIPKCRVGDFLSLLDCEVGVVKNNE